MFRIFLIDTTSSYRSNICSLRCGRTFRGRLINSKYLYFNSILVCINFCLTVEVSNSSPYLGLAFLLIFGLVLSLILSLTFFLILSLILSFVFGFALLFIFCLTLLFISGVVLGLTLLFVLSIVLGLANFFIFGFTLFLK